MAATIASGVSTAATLCPPSASGRSDGTSDVGTVASGSDSTAGGSSVVTSCATGYRHRAWPLARAAAMTPSATSSRNASTVNGASPTPMMANAHRYNGDASRAVRSVPAMSAMIAAEPMTVRPMTSGFAGSCRNWMRFL